MFIFSSILKLLFPFQMNYIETHFRPGLIYSRYYQKMPEILVDAPSFILPGKSLPLAIIIKDAHLFPIRLEKIIIKDELGKECYSENISKNVSEPLFYSIREINIDKFREKSFLELNVDIEITRKGKKYTISNHNLKGLKKESLKIKILKDKLPEIKGVHYADMHCHSEYTWDEIEYGAPLEVIAVFAKSMGFSYQPITDHSYDLDKKMHSCDVAKKSLPRWDALSQDVERYSDDQFIFIRGEEVSCGNDQGQNIHMLVMGNSDFIRGRGDRGDYLLRNKPDYHYREILETLPAPIPAIAAHPKEKSSTAEGLLLNRGSWDNENLDEKLTGLQIVNGHRGKEFQEGRKLWIKELLKGRKLFIYAGNDAHGHFNHYQQIQIPFISLKQNREKIYGRYRTALWMNNFNREAFLEAVNSGNCCITDGPLLLFGRYENSDFQSVSGRTLNKVEIADIKLFYRSSRDVVNKGEIIFYAGNNGNDCEKEMGCVAINNRLEFEINIEEYFKEEHSYLRAEILEKDVLCMTNPVFIDLRPET